jgi:epoxyqueuosine reductase QueG
MTTMGAGTGGDSDGDAAAGRAWLQRLTAELAARDLNLVGVAGPADYDAVVGPARRSAALLAGTGAIVVVGSGGPALWRRFRARLAADRRALIDNAHPLDRLVRDLVAQCDGEAAGAPAGVARRWFFAGADADLHLDFRVLGHLAGLGGRSRLGLLLHPEYGPWVGLRAACFVAAPIAPTGPDDADPCAGCPGYCAAACPGGAFPGGAWDVTRCGDFHVQADTCRTSCRSRLACPRGAAHRYPPDEITYHYDHTEGRGQLRQSLGIRDDEDPFPGDGPRWASWRDKVDVKG